MVHMRQGPTFEIIGSIESVETISVGICVDNVGYEAPLELRKV